MIEKRVLEFTDLGDEVYCDMCGEDWTERTEHGGFTFGSKAVCPDCAPSVEKSATKHGERKFIGRYCPPDKSFGDWVRQDLREGKPGFIKLVELE